MYKQADITDTTQLVIKNSIELLENHGESIADNAFALLLEKQPNYKRLFGSFPKHGSYTESLGNSLLQFAKYFTNLGLLNKKILKLVQKQVSLGIRHQHFEEVESALLGALQSELKLSDQHYILEEWSNAFWYVANILIELGENEYKSNIKERMGWDGFKTVIVAKKELLSHDTVKLTLMKSDGSAMPENSPGQYISMFIPELDSIRQYFLLSNSRDQFELAVKNEGEAGRFINESLEENSEVQVSMPAGGFNLDYMKGPVAIFSAGIGITPHLSLLSYLSKNQYACPVHHFYSVKSGNVNIFQSELKQYNKHSNFSDYLVLSKPNHGDRLQKKYDHDGRISKEFIACNIVEPENCNVFISGPKDYMGYAGWVLKNIGVNPEKIHFECFGTEIDIYDWAPLSSVERQFEKAIA